MLKTLVAAVACIGALSLAACEGSAEKAGENMDSAIEEATQGHENLGDGPLEQAGESIDEATTAIQTTIRSAHAGVVSPHRRHVAEPAIPASVNGAAASRIRPTGTN